MSEEDQTPFEPKIVAFCCNWCTYAGADLAGGMRLKYASNFVTIRVMCSARVSPHFIIRAFITAKRVAIMRRLLDFIGIPAERLRIEWIAASEGDKYARVVDEFTEQVRALGPSPLKAVRFWKTPIVSRRFAKSEATAETPAGA